MVLLAAGAGGVRAAGRPPVGVVKVNAGAGSVGGWLMNIFYGKKKILIFVCVARVPDCLTWSN